jgi:hypothetical protein
MPLILGTNSIKDTGYEVANSLRFDEPSNQGLSKTPSSAGNRRTFTFSVWLKRSKISNQTGDVQHFFESRVDSNDNCGLVFNTDDTLQVKLKIGGTNAKLITNRVFRDVSAFYNIVVAVDTTQSTNSNRNKLYINGVQETSFGTEQYPSQNADTTFNNTVAHAIGKRTDVTTQNFDGYIAEAVMIDGSALAPTSFGEFDEDSGIWKPIDVSGLTFGTNGFYLDFENSGSLGADVSGNGNNFTVNNLTSIDQSTDTCTNNFATLNPLVKAPSSITFSEGNLKAVHPGSWTGVPATIGVQSGKWYWECKITTGNSANAFTGICVEDINFNDSTVYDETGMITYFANGRKTVDGTETASFFSSLATNDIVGVALDLDSGTRTVTFTKNGSASGSAVNLTSNFDNKFIFPVGIGNSSSATANWEFNFGSPSYSISSGNSDGNGYGNFEYAVPSGYYALNTKNLAEFG